MMVALFFSSALPSKWGRGEGSFWVNGGRRPKRASRRACLLVLITKIYNVAPRQPPANTKKVKYRPLNMSVNK